MKTLVGLLPFALHSVALLVAAPLVSLGLPFTPLAAPAYALALMTLAGLASRPVHRHLREGRFDRDPSTRLYRGRMVYGAAWTTLYYCKPVLHAITTCPPLKRLVFRMFGYRGSLDFTIYPDTWVRDLRLLDFGAGTYIANRVTLGTNCVRSDGRIEVGSIRTGANVTVGHLAMIGGGSSVGARSEIGVAAKVGFKVTIGTGVSIGPNTVVDSGSRLRDGVVVGASAHIGKRCVLHAGVRVPAGAVIPDRSVLRSAADVLRVTASAEVRMAG